MNKMYYVETFHSGCTFPSYLITYCHFVSLSDTHKAPATTGLFGAPAPAAGGLFGAPSPGKNYE